MLQASLIPAGILVGAGAALLFGSRLWKRPRPLVWRTVGWLALASAAVAIAALPHSSPVTDQLADATSTRDGDAPAFDALPRAAAWSALALGALAAFSIAGARGRVVVVQERRFGTLLMCAGGMVLAAFADTIAMALVAMQLAALPAAALGIAEAGTRRGEVLRRTATLAVVSIGFLLAGAALVGHIQQSISLAPRATPAAAAPLMPRHHVAPAEPTTAADVGCLLLLAGFGIHLFAAPFHLAVGEVFEETSLWGACMTAVFSRGTALLLVVRVLVEGLPAQLPVSQTALASVALLTVLIGGAVIVLQSRIRRVLAFTVMIDAGAALAALSAACSSQTVRSVGTADSPWPGGCEWAWLCLFVHSLALIGLSTVIECTGGERTEGAEVARFIRSLRRDRVLAIVACLLLAGLGGLPLTAGYWGRLGIFSSILSVKVPGESGFFPHQNVAYVVVAVGVGTAWLLVAAMTLDIIRQIAFGPDRSADTAGDPTSETSPAIDNVIERRAPAASRRGTRWTAFVAAAALVALGVYPQPLFEVRSPARSTASQGRDGSHSASQGQRQGQRRETPARTSGNHQ